MIHAFSTRNWRWVTEANDICNQYLQKALGNRRNRGKGISDQNTHSRGPELLPTNHQWHLVQKQREFSKCYKVIRVRRCLISWRSKKILTERAGFVIKIDRDFKICLTMIELGYTKWHILLPCFFSLSKLRLSKLHHFCLLLLPSHYYHKNLWCLFQFLEALPEFIF